VFGACALPTRACALLTISPCRVRAQSKFIWGVVLGVGVNLGNGCTSGHGLCGLSRLSIRSLVAVPVFMVCAILSSTLSQIVENDGAFEAAAPAPAAMIAPETATVAGVAAGLLGVTLIPLLITRSSPPPSRPTLMISLAGLWCGLSAGVGLAVGGMVRVSSVRAALSPQRIDFSLWTLFSVALLTTFAIYTYAFKVAGVRKARILQTDSRSVDRQLVLGASLFGIGWGITGACPGPLVVVVAAQPTAPANLLCLLGVIGGIQLASTTWLTRLVSSPCSAPCAPCAPAGMREAKCEPSSSPAVSPPPSPSTEGGAARVHPTSGSAPFPSAVELLSALSAGAPICDLRPPTTAEANERGEFVTIDGVLSAPWDRASQTLPLDAMPADTAAPLIVICRSGSRAAKAIDFLRAAGYTAVLNGGGPLGPAELWETLVRERGALVHPLPGLLQLFDGAPPDGGSSSTLTYVVYDTEAKEAIIIDPVLEQVERDMAAVAQTGCQLVLALNTHCHADHITGTGRLRQKLPTLVSAISAASGAKADRLLSDDQVVTWAGGRRSLRVIATPGHTNGCLSFYEEAIGAVFTGDALLIGGCGRTDFQEGSSATLHASVHTRLFTLPPDTLVYPAHDYKGRRFSTIGLEAKTNPRLTQPLEQFVETMGALGLPYPKKIDASLPANMRCGVQDDPGGMREE
jgi:sulfur dioxygenase